MALDGGANSVWREERKKMMMMGRYYLAGGVVVVVCAQLLLLQNGAVLAEELEVARRRALDGVRFRAGQHQRKVQVALLETEAARGHFGQAAT